MQVMGMPKYIFKEYSLGLYLDKIYVKKKNHKQNIVWKLWRAVIWTLNEFRGLGKMITLEMQISIELFYKSWTTNIRQR